MSRNFGREQANQLCRKATQLIAQTEALPIPHNFQLFFEYAEGSNTALVDAVDQMLNTGSVPSPSELELLFDTYVDGDARSQEFGEMGDKLGREVRDALDIVADVAASTGSFQVSVTNAEAELGDMADPERVRLAVSSLVDATRHMSEHSAAMNSKLTASVEQIEELKSALELVTLESQKDALTGVANRKCFDQTLATEVLVAREQGRPLSLCMIDVDHFKAFNDKHGHRAGDAALRIAANMFDHSVRDYDLVARYGGEEFSVIMPNAELKVALNAANRIRSGLSSKEIIKRSTGERLGNITVSVGVAELRDSDTAGSLIERADTALYEAKRAGRNQVQPEQDQGTSEAPADDKVA